MGAQETLPALVADTSPSIFLNIKRFEEAQRVGTLLSKSTLVPKDFRENTANCVIALELAERMQTNVLMVMQHLAIVNGKPGWDGQFVIAKINSCGRYHPLQYETSGAGDEYGCIAWTTEVGSGRRLESPKVTWRMVKAERWDQKDGSKWKSMPEVMFGYRTASFFGKRHCPELLLGMHTREELEDIAPTAKDMGAADVVHERTAPADSDRASAGGNAAGIDLNAALDAQTSGEARAVSLGADASKTNDPPFAASRLIRLADRCTDLSRLDELQAEANTLPEPQRTEVLEHLAAIRNDPPKDLLGHDSTLSL
jgi:hypothetical protein